MTSSLQRSSQNDEHVVSPLSHVVTSDDVLAVGSNDEPNLFDLEPARQREAHRRRSLLGAYAHNDFDKKQLRAYAQRHCIPESVLIIWKRSLTQGGFESLLPGDWQPLTMTSQQRVLERVAQLGTAREHLDKGEEVTVEDIADLVRQQQWSSSRKAERLVRRYQIDGVWGLAPERDPERMGRRQEQIPPPELAAVTKEAVEMAEQRRALIAPYLARKRIPNEELRVYAKEHGSSLETLRKYLRDFRAHGLRGLLPRERRDKGHCHTISTRMEGVVAGLRLSQRDLPLHAVHARAKQRAHLLAEIEPTLWQVRQVCDSLSEPVKEIADERFGAYRSKHRMTYRYHFDGSVIVYQIDFTPVDVLVRDIRTRSLRTKSEEKRPYLITCVECSSRLVMSYLFTYDTPNSANIATVLYDALVVSENKPYGGIPEAVWVDQGKQLTSDHVQQIARDLHFDLHAGKPNFSEDRGDPQKRGRVERSFRTFSTQLWSTLPGYTHSNTKERHPDVQATLTLSELAEHFRDYIKDYHHAVHSETKQTPLGFWAEHCFAQPADPGQTSLLLQVLEHRDISKGFIQYGSRRYWHDDLWNVPADATVTIRAQPQYMRPDDIQVFYLGKWVCPAFALDSAAGRNVDGKRVLRAQRRQRKAIQQTIDEKRAIVQAANREIREQEEAQQAPNNPPVQQKHVRPQQTAPSVPSKPSPSRRHVPPPTVFPKTAKQAATAWEQAVAVRERQEHRQMGKKS